MRDDLPYFTHDNDARNHAKMKALRARFGWSGYGQFWALNEMVAGAAEARLDLSRKVVRASVACELGMTPDALEEFLAFLADPDECGLVSYEAGIVTTDRTQENFEYLMGVREKALERYRKKASPKNTETSAKSGKTSAKFEELPESSAKFETKESKVKESKGKESTHNLKAARADEVDPFEVGDDGWRPDVTLTEYQRLVREAWAELGDKVYPPPDPVKFAMSSWSKLSPAFRGVHSDDVLAAIRNFGGVVNGPEGKFYWKARIGIEKWAESHLDKFLPANFREEDFYTREYEDTRNPHLEKILAEMRGAT
jgi:hypothetical protein